MGGSVFVGRVVSNRMQKTVVVAVNYVVWNTKYKAYQPRVARHMAHDESQECVVGDVVKIKVSRRLSRHKTYRVDEVLKRAPVFEPEAAKEIIAKRDAARPADWVSAAQEKVTQAALRLQAVKEMYEKELGSAAATTAAPEAAQPAEPAAAAAPSSSGSHAKQQQQRSMHTQASGAARAALQPAAAWAMPGMGSSFGAAARALLPFSARAARSWWAL